MVGWIEFCDERVRLDVEIENELFPALTTRF